MERNWKTIGTMAMLWFLLCALGTGFAWAGFLDSMQPVTVEVVVDSDNKSPAKRPALQWPEMTPEKAFYYFIAIYGTPDNAIERYGNYFDAVNYKRAMADEFERGRYTEAIRARIADGVRKLNFADKFTLVGSTTFEGYTSLGEYSFATHSFPLVNLPSNSFCRNMDHSSGICYGTLMDVKIAGIKRSAVNGSEFTWAVPMSETEASAFVKSRSIGGSVNRRVTARITYSITNKKGEVDYAGRGGTFSPYIYSVEVFSDESLTKKLAVITPQPGTPISAFMPDAALAAQSATKVIATYHYTASCRENYKCVTPIVGTITLTDVGITLSGEQRNGSAKPSTTSFFSAFAGGDTNLWRANFTNGTWGGSDFRVVWQPFWQHDHESALVFADRQERDRFFVDLTVAMQEWAAKYSQFAFSKLSIYQQCESGGGHFVTCSESSPPEVNQQKTEPGDTAGTPLPAAKLAGTIPSTDEPMSLEKLSEEIEHGEQVVLKVKCNYASPGYVFLRDGVVTLSKASIQLSLPMVSGAGRVDYGFTVSPDKIIKLTHESQHLHLRVAVMGYDRKEKKRDFDLYNSGAVTVGVGLDGRIFSFNTANIACDGCADTMSDLYALLEKVRNGRK